MKLFIPELHEPLTKTSWSKDEAQNYLKFILDETLDLFDEEKLWPMHSELAKVYNFNLASGSLWIGATGTIVAINHLKQYCASHSIQTVNNVIDTLWPQQKSSLREFNTTIDCDTNAPGYLLGESSINLLAYCLSNDNKYSDSLHKNIVDNTKNPINELMWAAPGTMLAAIFANKYSPNFRWQDAFKDSADYLYECWEYDSNKDIYLWTQDMYGCEAKHLGIVHGFAGNVFALMKGFSWLSPEQQELLIDRTLQTFNHTALQDGDFANWMPCEGIPRAGRDKPFLQVCHGAPSMILGLADFWSYMDESTKSLMINAGNLIWHAGPLIKPWGLCHGNAGNGWAFLKLAHLTGDQIWLKRARCFAMHAIEQSRAMFAKYQEVRTDLWCGDLGLATYLQACIDETSQFITLDYFL